jgi:phosphate transport system substrate-binding protein
MKIAVIAIAFSATGLLAQDSSIFLRQHTRPDRSENQSRKVWYTKRWDLGGLPHYEPRQQVSGTLRFSGDPYLKNGFLADYWRDGFAAFQPRVKIEYNLVSSAIAIPTLYCGAADVGMSRDMMFLELVPYQEVLKCSPVQVKAVTGSYNVSGYTAANVILVNKENPLSGITMKQLDGVFGGARTGAYVGTAWHSEAPYSRGPEDNIRTWGQLGLTGEWEDKPIHIGGQNLRNQATVCFSNAVLKRSDQFAENYKAYANHIRPDGTFVLWTTEASEAVSNDRYAMCWAFPISIGPGNKALAIQGERGGPYVESTLETVHDNSYPLTGFMYLYANRLPGKPMDPKVDEFLHYVLSQEGQTEVERDGKYLPLTAGVVREQLKLLD